MLMTNEYIEEEFQEMQDSYEELKDEHEKLNNNYLRLAADFDNYKKRIERERISSSIFISEKIIVSLLPVLDDMERAMEHSNDGISLVHKKFISALNSLGVTEVPYDRFHTDYHEAISIIQGDTNGMIHEVLQKGYKLNDKVIRHAKVVVTI